MSVCVCVCVCVCSVCVVYEVECCECIVEWEHGRNKCLVLCIRCCILNIYMSEILSPSFPKVETQTTWLGRLCKNRDKEEPDGKGAKIFKLRIKGARIASTYRHSSSLQEKDKPTGDMGTLHRDSSC